MILFYLFFFSAGSFSKQVKTPLKAGSNTIKQGRPGFWGIQYFGVFNFRYTVFLFLKLGIKHYGLLEFWYSVY